VLSLKQVQLKKTVKLKKQNKNSVLLLQNKVLDEVMQYEHYISILNLGAIWYIVLLFFYNIKGLI
jgi:hypothetical protein